MSPASAGLFLTARLSRIVVTCCVRVMAERRANEANARREPNEHPIQVRLVLLQLIFHFVDAGVDAGLIDAG
jgi:hypothetical protein